MQFRTWAHVLHVNSVFAYAVHKIQAQMKSTEKELSTNSGWMIMCDRLGDIVNMLYALSCFDLVATFC